MGMSIFSEVIHTAVILLLTSPYNHMTFFLQSFYVSLSSDSVNCLRLHDLPNWNKEFDVQVTVHREKLLP